MRNKAFLIIFFLMLILASCNDTSNKNSRKSNEDVFANVKKESQVNLTKEDRIKSYKKSLIADNEISKEIENKSYHYTGYGISQKKEVRRKKNEIKSSKKKKFNKPNANNFQQINMSAYSLN